MRALPTLIWVDEKGEEVTRRGVPLLISDPDVNSYPWEDKLVYDVVDSVDGIVEEPILIAFLESASDEVQQKTVEVSITRWARLDEIVNGTQELKVVAAKSCVP